MKQKEENDMESKTKNEKRLAAAAELALNLEKTIQNVIIGQRPVVRQVTAAFLAGGHVLIEGVPGLGKTLLVRAMAAAIGGQFGRVQFTPDLMPADISGHSMFDKNENRFVIRKGPVFCNLLLADEINRAPAKTQAALLEAMQEQQVTIDGQSFVLDRPFLVMATQNPIEQEGTYPLPQAQTDRFIFKVHISYPQAADEAQVIKTVTKNSVGDTLDVKNVKPILTPAQMAALQAITASLTVDDQLIDYVVRLVRATRKWNGIERGAGPRGAISLLRAARAMALISGRGYVIPDHVKEIAIPVLRHRITLSTDLHIEGYTPDQVLEELIGSVEAPRS
ncbi:MAG: AAA family ATPase [Deltaproteobacteria bacterium]|nr:MAG: AAA family ATPase [Deltaproteobacteria bacterium]